jgi:hypothetical protein
MAADERRAHRRYPAWFPINVRLDGSPELLPAMLCDVSVGGALVWGFWSNPAGDHVVLDVVFRSAAFEIPGRIVSVEGQWDTVILHVQFEDGLVQSSERMRDLIRELKSHFEAYQVYLAHRADDDLSLGRPAPAATDRASA